MDNQWQAIKARKTRHSGKEMQELQNARGFGDVGREIVEMARAEVFAGVPMSRGRYFQNSSACGFTVYCLALEAPCCQTSNVFLQLMSSVTGHHSFTLKIDLVVLHLLSAYLGRPPQQLLVLLPLAEPHGVHHTSSIDLLRRYCFYPLVLPRPLCFPLSQVTLLFSNTQPSRNSHMFAYLSLSSANAALLHANNPPLPTSDQFSRGSTTEISLPTLFTPTATYPALDYHDILPSALDCWLQDHDASSQLFRGHASRAACQRSQQYAYTRGCSGNYQS